MINLRNSNNYKMQTLSNRVKYKTTGLSIPEELFKQLETKRAENYESRSHLYTRLLKSASRSDNK